MLGIKAPPHDFESIWISLWHLSIKNNWGTERNARDPRGFGECQNEYLFSICIQGTIPLGKWSIQIVSITTSMNYEKIIVSLLTQPKGTCDNLSKQKCRDKCKHISEERNCFHRILASYLDTMKTPVKPLNFSIIIW